MCASEKTTAPTLELSSSVAPYCRDAERKIGEQIWVQRPRPDTQREKDFHAKRRHEKSRFVTVARHTKRERLSRKTTSRKESFCDRGQARTKLNHSGRGAAAQTWRRARGSSAAWYAMSASARGAPTINTYARPPRVRRATRTTVRSFVTCVRDGGALVSGLPCGLIWSGSGWPGRTRPGAPISMG